MLNSYEALFAGGLIGGFLVAGIVVALALYLYTAFALFTIAKNQKVEYPWLAFIPLANIWVFVRSGGLNGWWVLAAFASLIHLIGQLAVFIGMIYVWSLIAKR